MHGRCKGSAIRVWVGPMGGIHAVRATTWSWSGWMRMERRPHLERRGAVAV